MWTCIKTIVFVIFLIGGSFVCLTQDHGEFPHGRVFMTNSLDADPVDVELEVNKSGNLDGEYVEVFDLEDEDGRTISLNNANVTQITIYYHSHNMAKFLLKSGFGGFSKKIKIFINENFVGKKNYNPVVVDFKKKTITYFKNSLVKHAKDADIISSAVAKLYIHEFFNFPSDKALDKQAKSVIDGFSYYAACALSEKATYAKSVSDIDLSGPKFGTEKNQKELHSLRFASILWKMNPKKRVTRKKQ